MENKRGHPPHMQAGKLLNLHNKGVKIASKFSDLLYGAEI